MIALKRLSSGFLDRCNFIKPCLHDFFPYFCWNIYVNTKRKQLGITHLNQCESEIFRDFEKNVAGQYYFVLLSDCFQKFFCFVIWTILQYAVYIRSINVFHVLIPFVFKLLEPPACRQIGYGSRCRSLRKVNFTTKFRKMAIICRSQNRIWWKSRQTTGQTNKNGVA